MNHVANRVCLIPLSIVVAVLLLNGATIQASGQPPGRPRTKSRPTPSPTPGPRSTARSTVTASGEVRPLQYVNVTSEVAGRIEEVYVKEGQLVTKGQPLLRLDPSQLQSNDATQASTLNAKKDLDATLAQARQQYVAAQTEVDRAQIDLNTAQRELKRMSDLVEAGVASRAEYDAARDRVEQARVTLRTANANRETRRIGVEDAKARLNQHEALLRGQSSRRKSATQLSPLSGVVAEIPIRVGEFATGSPSGKPLMTIADMSTTNLAIKLDETEISKVKVGHRATIIIDAFSPRAVYGVVTRKNPLPVANYDPQLVPSSAVGAQTAKEFEVTVELRRMSAEIRKGVRPGMSATATISIGN